MRRTITGTASIYTHAEIVELKYLLLQLCQQRLYSSTGGGRGGDKETVSEARRGESEERKEESERNERGVWDKERARNAT